MSNTPDRLTAAYNQVKKDLRMITSPNTWRNMTQNQIIGGLTVALLVIGVITGVYLGGQNAENRQRAFTPYDSCISGDATCIGKSDGDYCGDSKSCLLNTQTGACTCKANNSCSSKGEVCNINNPCCGGQLLTCDDVTGLCRQNSCEASGGKCVTLGDCAFGGVTGDGICGSSGGVIVGECCFPGPTIPGGTSPSPTATPPTGGGTTPTNTPPTGTTPTNTPPNNPTPTNTPPAGVNQATIRICKAIRVNGVMQTDWNSLPETRFRVQFDKKPPLRDLPGENGVPSDYGTKNLDTISFKTTDPGNLQQRPNIDNVYAACQDLVVDYNNGDRQDVTYMKETIEQKDSNGNWVTASNWNAPVYNDSILIKDIDGNDNTTDSVSPSVTGIYDESLFDGSSDQDAIGRTRYSDGYIRVNNAHNRITMLMINDLQSTGPTVTNTPGNGPVCVNVTLNDLTNPDPNNPPTIGDNVTLTCAQVAGAIRYEFAMKQPDNNWVSISPSSSVINVSDAFSITMAGHYVVQCRPCTGRAEATCSDWEVPLN